MSEMETPPVETQTESFLPDVNDTEPAINGTTGKIPATPEGLALAYSSLVIMALLPIFFGSFRSVKSQKEVQENSATTGEKPEVMSQKDAAMFPLIASCALFGLYLFFQFFSKEHINLLLSVYFFVLGIFALSHMISPGVKKLLPTSLIHIENYHLEFHSGEGDQSKELLNIDFTTHDIITSIGTIMVSIWHFRKKHWIANNIFAIAHAMTAIEMVRLNMVINGCILLSGLFFYDIFWVFGTDVMTTVAKNFDAPVLLKFPHSTGQIGPSQNMAMLGLGDIVIPGIFVALLLRYDQSLKRNSNFYFYTTFIAYILGLCGTIVVMHVFKHAQPALLYLVPACLGAPLFMALIRGDLKSMFNYADHPEEETEKEKKDQ